MDNDSLNNTMLIVGVILISVLTCIVLYIIEYCPSVNSDDEYT